LRRSGKLFETAFDFRRGFRGASLKKKLRAAQFYRAARMQNGVALQNDVARFSRNFQHLFERPCLEVYQPAKALLKK